MDHRQAFFLAQLGPQAQGECYHFAERWVRTIRESGNEAWQVTVITTDQENQVHPPCGAGEWNFHTAACIQSDDDYWAIDPKLFPSGPLPVRVWADRLGGSPFIHDVVPRGNPVHFIDSKLWNENMAKLGFLKSVCTCIKCLHS